MAGLLTQDNHKDLFPFSPLVSLHIPFQKKHDAYTKIQKNEIEMILNA